MIEATAGYFPDREAVWAKASSCRSGKISRGGRNGDHAEILLQKRRAWRNLQPRLFCSEFFRCI